MSIFGFGKKSGIAFGGGGTRGIAHIGAIKVFQKNKVDFDYVAGTSIGSLVGAVYALGVPWQEMYDHVLSIKERTFFPKKNWISYMSAEVIEKMADYYLEGKTFDELKKPFCAVAVDLKRGQPDRLSTGRLSKALSASCAMPGVFQPVAMGDKLYVDGGTLRSIPTQTVREMGAEKVVGINLNSHRGNGTESLRRRDVFIAAYKLTVNVNSEICERYADIMLRPELCDYQPYSFKNIQEMLDEGEREAQAHIEEIIKLLN